jgi:hypothetical protein
MKRNRDLYSLSRRRIPRIGWNKALSFFAAAAALSHPEALLTLAPNPFVIAVMSEMGSLEMQNKVRDSG